MTKMGRPRVSNNGEAKTQKISVYVTPSTFDDLNTLAGIEGMETSRLVSFFIEREINARRNDIDETKTRRQYQGL